ncbi:VanW family protein [Microlunatus soli]|uniref:Vancomycin resistance protein YoaR, contains peptidoglycan-binding and VanW domains n=1 Tax=Microlunatus soli TaxID=630515 RepID=A0A1H1QA19_9ACTN|nr:VanW family protein [Microlunatus soli]SDS20153.1 Vancomycin resistance protein YoaR, contains peptidoglycan-binding and VanW domains [Microlunatus soli]
MTKAGDKSARTRRGPKIIGISVGTLIALGAVLYVIGYLLTGDRVARNTTVAGVEIGGLTREDAEARLRDRLTSRTDRPIKLDIAGRTDTVDPQAAGIDVDYSGTIDEVGIGRSLDPRRIWAGLTGGREVAPLVVTDRAKLSAAVDELAETYDRKPKSAKVKITDDEPAVEKTEMVTGRTLDQSTAERVIPRGLLTDSPVTVPVNTTDPEITDAEVDALVDKRLQPALSAPVTVTAGDNSATVTPTMIARSLEIDRSDDKPTAELKPQRLHELAEDALDGLKAKPAKDADVVLKGGKPTVVPGKPGTGVTADELAKAVDSAMIKSGDQRTAEVKLSEIEPDLSTAEAQKLGVKEVTGEFTTHYPYAEYRNVNIGRAAELINGTLLEPGEIFSLNEVVGERTAENGFTEGSIITGGKFKAELGGGVSQSATTTYNAMFFAGLEDIEHQPHTLYIDRYPAGREATVAWPTLDLKFRNNTDYGVLVQATLDAAEPGGQGSLTVKMWSTKTYDKIESTDPVKSDFTDGQDITDDSSTCVATTPVQGFHVTYSRVFTKDGKQVRKEDFSWTYDPTDRRVCV